MCVTTNLKPQSWNMGSVQRWIYSTLKKDGKEWAGIVGYHQRMDHQLLCLLQIFSLSKFTNNNFCEGISMVSTAKSTLNAALLLDLLASLGVGTTSWCLWCLHQSVVNEPPQFLIVKSQSSPRWFQVSVRKNTKNRYSISVLPHAMVINWYLEIATSTPNISCQSFHQQNLDAGVFTICHQTPTLSSFRAYPPFPEKVKRSPKETLVWHPVSQFLGSHSGVQPRPGPGLYPIKSHGSKWPPREFTMHMPQLQIPAYA